MLQDESLWTPEVSTVGGAVSAEMWISERVGQYQVRFIRSRRVGQVWLQRDVQSAIIVYDSMSVVGGGTATDGQADKVIASEEEGSQEGRAERLPSVPCGSHAGDGDQSSQTRRSTLQTRRQLQRTDRMKDNEICFDCTSCPIRPRTTRYSAHDRGALYLEKRL